MKKFNKIWIGLLLVTVVLTSCDSLLDVKSERYVFPEDHLLNSTDKALYGMNGLFSELGKLTDRYVLLGELRGDLMDVTDVASPDIKALNDFTFTADNPYVDSKDYYSIINNCNYILTSLDTTIIQHAQKVLLQNYAVTKAIRAWTYMQIGLNYGKAKYYDEPILSITDAKKDYPEYTIDQLVDVLIQDLEPWVNEDQPEPTSIGEDVNSSQLFFPVRFVLGDLYLWKGQYEQAASQYYQLIYDNEYVMTQNRQSRWYVENNAFINSILVNWRLLFDFGETETITMLASSLEHGEGSILDTLVNQRDILIPSAPAMQNWNSQVYYHSATLSRDGDLRGNLGSYIDYQALSDIGFIVGGASNQLYITKYNSLINDNTKAALVYRIGLLYLRYAEAVNRAGKPNLAFATLKNGLSAATMRLDTIVPPSEKYISYTADSEGVFYSYADFEDVWFNENIGVHERGCGQVHLAKDYIIPELGSLQDSIEYVEDKIVDELALETAFEGNRFQDLMRISMRRNDPSYLAKKVAAKHPEMESTLEAKLEDMNNWYLPNE